jgi:hypothetical protein
MRCVDGASTRASVPQDPIVIVQQRVERSPDLPRDRGRLRTTPQFIVLGRDLSDVASKSTCLRIVTGAGPEQPVRLGLQVHGTLGYVQRLP